MINKLINKDIKKQSKINNIFMIDKKKNQKTKNKKKK